MARDITGEIKFLGHTTDGSPPWVDLNPKLSSQATNSVRAPARVIIHDLRGKENTVDLDTHGFEILKYDGHTHDEFDDGSEMQQSYYEDIVALLKKRLGASRVVIFNHVFRFRGPLCPADRCDLTHKNPALEPHVDNDPPAVRSKMEEILGEEEAKKMMQNRFQLINVWRPLGPNPIMNVPLIICDYRSLDLDNDIHVVKVRGSNNTFSGYQISCNAHDAQKWYYLSQMRSNEMFIFKIFDSNPNVAGFGAHAGLINEHVPATDLVQKSIEIRCFIFYDI